MRNRSGFTITELLVVVVVISILAAIALTTYAGLQKRAATSAVRADLQSAYKVLQGDYIGTGSYPATLAEANGGKGLSFGPDTAALYTATSSTFCLSLRNTRQNAVASTTDQNVVTESSCSSWAAQYYSNTTLSGTPAVTATETGAINYSWGSGGPTGVGVDNFSARWSANFLAPNTGTYTFYVTSDDGQRLYINGAMVVDNWVAQGPTPRTATVNLTAGSTVSIVYEYYEVSGGAVAQLEWMPPGGTRAFFVPGS